MKKAIVQKILKSVNCCVKNPLSDSAIEDRLEIFFICLQDLEDSLLSNEFMREISLKKNFFFPTPADLREILLSSVRKIEIEKVAWAKVGWDKRELAFAALWEKAKTDSFKSHKVISKIENLFERRLKYFEYFQFSLNCPLSVVQVIKENEFPKSLSTPEKMVDISLILKNFGFKTRHEREEISKRDLEIAKAQLKTMEKKNA